MKILNQSFESFDSNWWDRFYLTVGHECNQHDVGKFVLINRWIRLRFSDNVRLIDFGFGEGHFLAAFLDEFPAGAADGVDWSPIAVSRARAQFPKCEFYLHDVYQEFKSIRSYDVAIATEVIEHLTDPVPLIRSMCGCADVVIITTPDEYWCERFVIEDRPLLARYFAHTELNYHYAAFSREDLRRLFSPYQGTVHYLDYSKTHIAVFEREH